MHKRFVRTLAKQEQLIRGRQQTQPGKHRAFARCEVQAAIVSVPSGSARSSRRRIQVSQYFMALSRVCCSVCLIVGCELTLRNRAFCQASLHDAIRCIMQTRCARACSFTSLQFKSIRCCKSSAPHAAAACTSVGVPHGAPSATQPCLARHGNQSHARAGDDDETAKLSRAAVKTCPNLTIWHL